MIPEPQRVGLRRLSPARHRVTVGCVKHWFSSKRRAIAYGKILTAAGLQWSLDLNAARATSDRPTGPGMTKNPYNSGPLDDH